MNYQPNLRIGFPVDPIPQPRQSVRRYMLATSMLVDGPVNVQPDRIDGRLANTLLMTQAELFIVGTGCRRPLMLREAADLSTAASLDAIVVRTDDDGVRISFDVKKVSTDRMFTAYRLWMRGPAEAPYLIPTGGEMFFIRPTPFGLEVTTHPPFTTEVEKQVGLVHGAVYLSVATKGWF